MLILKDESQNLYLYIYTNDHIPAHVHVFKGRKNDTNRHSVKINIGNENEPPSIVKVDPDMRNEDIKVAWRLVAANQEILLKKWNEIHGVQKLESNQRGGTRRSNRKGKSGI
ncbi:DUF4160 domain-containing protein [Pseudanabaena sp. lw0831]|uniref:DUF4160 domain-containing protein n=1 Tax=Pseudanabaena sp. lw0831 TaxID=1357935 RepID=UPI0022A82E54|nr:DUF4160 domain-containing protein [Pseudanabaena sp. lw0831]